MNTITFQDQLPIPEADAESRRMFVARLEHMAQNGDRWLTVEAVLALLNDCDMLASNQFRAALAAQPAKPLFADLIAQHEGLKEELAAMDGPAWHDAPTGPGLWVLSDGTALVLESGPTPFDCVGLRWFGPIPPDSGETQ
jgi:hypothetical protein